MFGHKNNHDPGKKDAAATAAVGKDPTKKNAKDRMSKSLSESVPEAVVAKMAECERFRLDGFTIHKNENNVADSVRFTGDDSVVYAGLFLCVDSDDVMGGATFGEMPSDPPRPFGLVSGGFSRKNRGKDKFGSIAYAIKTQVISALITPDLMNKECLVIVPNPTTITAMAEHGPLVDMYYILAFVQPDPANASDPTIFMYDPHAENSVPFISFKDVKAISDGGQGDLIDWLTDNDVPWVNTESQTDDADPNATQTMEPVAGALGVPHPAGPVSDDGEDVSSLPEAPDDEDEAPVASEPEPAPAPAIAEPQPQPVDDAPEQAPVDDVPVDNGDAEEEPQEPVDEQPSEPQSEPEPEISDEAFDETIERKFYSGDLKLAINTDAFDAQFLHNNPYIPFEENRGTDELARYTSQLAINANTELKRMHEQDLMNARNLYMTLLSMYVEGITKDLDPDFDSESESGTTQVGKDDTPSYRKLKKSIDANRDADLDNLPQIVSQRRDVITKIWDEKLKNVGEAAAVAAKQQYREQYEKQYQEKLDSLSSAVTDEIMGAYNDTLRDFNALRRSQAEKRLDYAITEVLRNVSDTYAQSLAKEREATEQWQKRIADYVANHQHEQIKHDDTVAKQLEADRRVADLTAQHEQELKDYQDKLDEFRAKAKSDLDQAMADNDRKLKEQSDKFQARLDEANGRADAANAKATDAVERATAECEQIQTSANAEIERAHRENDEERKNSTHRTVLVFVCAIFAVIAASCATYVVGNEHGITSTNETAKTAVNSQMSKKLDELSKENKELKQQQEEESRPSPTQIPQQNPAPQSNNGNGQTGSNSGSQH